MAKSNPHRRTRGVEAWRILLGSLCLFLVGGVWIPDKAFAFFDGRTGPTTATAGKRAWSNFDFLLGYVRHRNQCSLAYNLEADVDVPLPSFSPTEHQATYDRLSWRSFLALNSPRVHGRVARYGDNRTQWQGWSSTVDLIRCQRDPDSCLCPDGNCGRSGSRSYPQECQAIPGYHRYRVLQQVSKVDDSIDVAIVGGLSDAPVIDSSNRFLRYEIVISPATYEFVIANRYYDDKVLEALTEPVIFPCGEPDYRGGDPADPRMGAIVLKNGWMELDHRHRYKHRAHYHTEKLLVYTPGYRESDGQGSCELKEMALIAQHMMHKTVSQPNWIFATFEHKKNAPDCTALPPAGVTTGAGPSTACPTRVRRNYNLFARDCSNGAAGASTCQACNAMPESNADGFQCVNPDIENDVGWCLDLPPNKDRGRSKLCRQVPVAENYPDAHAQNRACARALGRWSVWSNYQLISTQWYNFFSDTCQTAFKPDRTQQQPQIDVSGDGSNTRPFLANTAIEPYIRSNCMACHGGASVDREQKIGTDNMYWLQIEVGGVFQGP